MNDQYIQMELEPISMLELDTDSLINTDLNEIKIEVIKLRFTVIIYWP